MLSIKETPQGIIFKIFVQPKSSRNMLAGLYEDSLKIKITAPPVNNAANKMCIKFLSKCLNIPKSSLEIISGQTSRTKQVICYPKNEQHIETMKKNIISLVDLPEKKNKN